MDYYFVYFPAIFTTKNCRLVHITLLTTWLILFVSLNFLTYFSTLYQASLRQLILKSCNDDDKKSEVARFAKNFLPILFNLFTTKPIGAEETGQRMSVFESIKLYFSLADSGLLGEMFDKAFERNRDTSTELFVRDSCLELLRVMMSFVDESRVKRMYDLGMTQLANKDHKIQKRSYRVLEEICGSGSTGLS